MHEGRFPNVGSSLKTAGGGRRGVGVVYHLLGGRQGIVGSIVGQREGGREREGRGETWLGFVPSKLVAHALTFQGYRPWRFDAWWTSS